MLKRLTSHTKSDSPRSAQVGVKCKYFTLACNCVFYMGKKIIKTWGKKQNMEKKQNFVALYMFLGSQKFLRIGLQILDSSETVFIASSTQEPNLVPRPHPLTRRNGLVNQVEFLGLWSMSWLLTMVI